MITFLSLGKHGELGNQLFQIAATIGYALKFNKEYIFPKWFCERSQIYYNPYFETGINDNLDPASFLQFTTYNEKSLRYEPFLNIEHKNINLFGYFQCEEYFKHCKNIINNTFQPSKTILNKIKKLNFSNSISLQLRYYDRSSYDPQNIFVSIEQNLEYLKTAINYFGKNKTYYVNTNNYYKAKKLFSQYNNFIFLDEYSQIEQFFVQTMCEHNIITNSSFGWWGAYLNLNTEKIVFSPKKWFLQEDNWFSSQNIHCENWKVI